MAKKRVDQKLREWRIITLIAGGLGLTGGLVMAIWSWVVIQSALDSVAWPTVTGRVVHSEFTEERRARRGDDPPRTYYCAQIRYAYVVQGEELVGDRVQVGGAPCTTSGDDVGRIRARVARYPLGREVVVHHDPADATIACLEPGLLGDTVFGFALGCFLFLGALPTAASGFFPDRRLQVLIGGLVVAVLVAVVTGLTVYLA